MSEEIYQIYAIKYGELDRPASENFIGSDDHDTPMPLNFYVWLIQGRNRCWVVDTGFDAAMGQKRNRKFIRDPGDALQLMGINHRDVEDVIVTHFHYDHCGNHHLFERARFHIQDKEMQYTTGRCMCMPTLQHAYSLEDVTKMVQRVYEGNVVFHDGDEQIAPGISLHHVGGHTMGLQMVRVATQRGWVVLASDAAHFYANIEQGRPFPIVYNVYDMLAGHRKAYALASSPQHVIPGHDPLVFAKYPAPRPELNGIVARLDVAPL